MNPPPLNLVTPVERAQLIERSLRAFGFGWLGLVPLIGLPFAIGAVIYSVGVWRLERHIWNPAARYRLAAILVGLAGVVISGSCILVALVRLVGEAWLE